MAAPVQRNLARDGYYQSEVDGIIDAGTRRAIPTETRTWRSTVEMRANYSSR